jgi:hypothetical protein
MAIGLGGFASASRVFCLPQHFQGNGAGNNLEPYPFN